MGITDLEDCFHWYVHVFSVILDVCNLLNSGPNINKTKLITFQSSLMSHNCIPNVYQVFSRSPPYTAKCFASIDIMKGEEIFTSYLSSTFSSLTRRKKLKDSWYFDCVCEVRGGAWLVRRGSEIGCLINLNLNNETHYYSLFHVFPNLFFLD